MDLGEGEEVPKPEKYTLTPTGPEGGDAKPTSIGYSGQGKGEYINGDTFEGTYVDGARQGPGVYKYNQKTGYDIFEGSFEANKKDGLGMMKYKPSAPGKSFPDGGFYHGHYVAGKRHGEGTFKYPNGDIYSGMWKEGKRHGKGTYVFAGTKYEMKGTWREGQITQGTWTLTDGTRYVGGFRNQKPCGDGIWETAKGTIVEGAYVQQVVPIDGDKSKKVVPGSAPATETRIFWKTATMVGAED